MALITCADCSTEVSDQAKACPKCGRPVAKVEQEKKTSPLVYAGLAVAVIGGLMWVMHYGVFGILVAIAGGAMYLVGVLSPSK